MNKETIFNLNKLADEHETLAKAYRIVANNMMNGLIKHGRRHYDDPSLTPTRKPAKKKTPKKMGIVKGYKFNGTHWMQRPENKTRVMRRIKQMQRQARAKRKAQR